MAIENLPKTKERISENFDIPHQYTTVYDRRNFLNLDIQYPYIVVDGGGAHRAQEEVYPYFATQGIRLFSGRYWIVIRAKGFGKSDTVTIYHYSDKSYGPAKSR